MATSLKEAAEAILLAAYQTDKDTIDSIFMWSVVSKERNRFDRAAVAGLFSTVLSKHSEDSDLVQAVANTCSSDLVITQWSKDNDIIEVARRLVGVGKIGIGLYNTVASTFGK